MDLTNGIMLGRPYGGVGVLWHNSLDASVTAIVPLI